MRVEELDSVEVTSPYSYSLCVIRDIRMDSMRSRGFGRDS